VRRSYLEGTGFFGYVSVEQDASGEATARLLALAHAAGCLRKGALPLSARNEALLSLLIDQTVNPYLSAAIQMAFMLGVGAGLPAEAMVLEMYMSGEMSCTFQGFAEVGFMESMGRQGAVAQYGGLLRTLEMDREGMHRMFGAVLEDIRSGGFARRFQAEHAAGHPSPAAISALQASGSLMTDAERRVRAALGE
jgi:ketol-acid reductoisomerase